VLGSSGTHIHSAQLTLSILAQPGGSTSAPTPPKP
jgi:hypothetical protein